MQAHRTKTEENVEVALAVLVLIGMWSVGFYCFLNDAASSLVAGLLAMLFLVGLPGVVIWLVSRGAMATFRAAVAFFKKGRA